MANQNKERDTRYMELSVPQELITDTAEIIEQNEIEATILGIAEEEDCITVGFTYTPAQRENLMEIMELIEDYKDDENEEVETEEEEDN